MTLSRSAIILAFLTFTFASGSALGQSVTASDATGSATGGSATTHALMCTKGKLIFEDDFSTAELDKRWSPAKGEWKIESGALRGTELESDNHAASIRTNIELPSTMVMEFDFKFDGGKVIHCSFNGKGHICRATIYPNGFTLRGEKVKKDPKDKAVTVGQVKQEFAKGQTYTMRIEIAGEEFVARVDGGPVAFGSHSKIARAKTNFGFPMAGVSSQIDNIKIWNAEPNPRWAELKKGLPENKITPLAPPTPKERFARMDKDKNGSLSVDEFNGNRPKSKRESVVKQFNRKDKDSSGTLSLEEFAPAKKSKK
ncbi:MAG: EF-hand domain-containing protein [Mariniblastus sp.]